jgi:hypothetical protein
MIEAAKEEKVCGNHKNTVLCAKRKEVYREREALTWRCCRRRSPHTFSIKELV